MGLKNTMNFIHKMIRYLKKNKIKVSNVLCLKVITNIRFFYFTDSNQGSIDSRSRFKTSRKESLTSLSRRKRKFPVWKVSSDFILLNNLRSEYWQIRNSFESYLIKSKFDRGHLMIQATSRIDHRYISTTPLHHLQVPLRLFRLNDSGKIKNQLSSYES